MNEPRQIPAEDLALYAMQALSVEEMAIVAAALRDNPDAQQELARIHGDLALLALSSEQHAAPYGAFERLQARMRAESRANDAYRISSVPKRRSRWWSFTPWAIAAGLAIACGIFRYQVGSLKGALESQSRLTSSLAIKASLAERVLEVLSAPDAQRVTLTATKTPPAPTAHAIYVPGSGALLMQATHLQSLPANKTYELWVIPASGAAPIPAGIFRPDAEGYASVVLPQLPSGVPAKAFGITIENAGGSATPTMPIILSGE